MQRRGREVAEGQHYQKVGPGGGAWEIVAVRTDTIGATHARMRSVLEPTTFRTFAVEAVLDLRNFRLIEDSTGLAR